MASAWRPGAVTWGGVALYLLLVVQVSSWLMRRIPRRLWHRIHLLSFAVFAAGTIHGALAGADSGTPLVQFAAVAVRTGHADARRARQVDQGYARCRLLAQRRVQRGAGIGHRIRAAVQIQVVIAVAAVEAAARGGDQPAVAQQP